MDQASTKATRPSRGAELELSIDSLAFGGAGVARLDGYVVFVAGGMPGDRVRVVVGKAKRAYAQARVVEILEPGPDRVPPLAEHPGAPWQVLRYERQLEVKQAQVEDALRRIGRLDGFSLEPIVPAVEQWRYRNKLEYSFGTATAAATAPAATGQPATATAATGQPATATGADQPSTAGRLVCGFHAPGGWQEIVEVTECLLASEAADAVRERVAAWCRDQRLDAFDRRTGKGFLRNLVVREGRRSGQLQIRLVTSAGDLDRDGLAALAAPGDSVLWTRLHDVGETTQGGETELLAGRERLEEELGGMRLRISPQAFFQTNTEMAERLYALAIELAGLGGFERVYDLYCGIGTIGLLIAPRVAELWGLELAQEAVADAIANARRNEIDNARFFAGDVRLALRELTEQAGRPEVLVIDPPRAGLSQKVVRRIIETAPKRIVYISCNPTTLAPNAAQLVEAGYELGRVAPVDMFPQTPHIECVAILDGPARR